MYLCCNTVHVYLYSQSTVSLLHKYGKLCILIVSVVCICVFAYACEYACVLARVSVSVVCLCACHDVCDTIPLTS